MNEKRDTQPLKETGAHLRQVRKSLDKTLDEVEVRCDVDKSNLSAIENGKKDFTMTTLLELARGLGTRSKKLLDKEFEFLEEWYT